MQRYKIQTLDIKSQYILKANSGGKGVAEMGNDLDGVSSKDVENDLTLDGGDGCTTL